VEIIKFGLAISILSSQLCRRLRLGGWIMPAWARKFMRSHLNVKELGMVIPTCHPSYSRKPKLEDHGSGQAMQKARPYLQDNQSKKDWKE
jgi:hypothetical protein